MDAFGHVRLGGVGQQLAEEVERRTGKESRAVVLGHVQRGGTPTAFDRVLATRFGLAAIDAVQAGAFGQMVALRGTDIVRVPLSEATAELKTVAAGAVRGGRGLLRVTGRVGRGAGRGLQRRRHTTWKGGMGGRTHLAGRRIAFLVANEGVEQIELIDPWQAVEQDGGQPVLLAPEPGQVQAFNHLDRGAVFPVRPDGGRGRVEDFAGLVLPGGVANPDHLRTQPGAVALVREFVDAGKPVAAICHAPWTLVEAGAVEGKTLTSWPSLRTDLVNAGGTWVDETVRVDPAGGWTLVTSRKPGDLPAFCREMCRAFAA